MFAGHGACGHGENAYTPHRFARAESLTVEDLFDACLQRGEMLVQQSRLHLFQEPLNGKKGVEFGGVEPEAGKFIGPSFLSGVLVAVVTAVVVDRRAKEVAHILDDTAKRGTRAFEPALQFNARYRVARIAQQSIQEIDSIEAVHAFLPVSICRIACVLDCNRKARFKPLPSLFAGHGCFSSS